MVTIRDLIKETGVPPRTIRWWIQQGYFPRPKKISNGYKKGVIGYYPDESIDIARRLHLYLTKKVIKWEGEKYTYEFSKLDGVPKLTIKSKVK